MINKKMNKPKLSKSILEMKFMQRSKAKVAEEDEAAEGRAMYSSEITDKMLHGNSNFIIEPSYVPCENLIPGRLSFRGMNPEIEQLLEIERQQKLDEAKQSGQATDVNDEEMVKHYHEQCAPTPSDTLEKEFQKHKKTNNHKKSNNNEQGTGKQNQTKFMKPQMDDDAKD